MLLPCSSWNTKFLTASINFIIFVADGITTCLADVIANYIVADGITTLADVIANMADGIAICVYRLE